jgi:hypothetical protein
VLNPRRFSFGGTAGIVSFVAILLTLPKPYAGIVAFGWGDALLAMISYVLDKAGDVGPIPEVVKHLG